MKTPVGYDSDDGDEDEPPRPNRDVEKVEPPGLGEQVRITDGPFTDFEGIVDSVDQEKGKVRARVLMYGRETPIELDLSQVEKLA